jgi:cell division septation protein DedD
MDSGLKKRLIGAAVLIVLAVIFVPMLLPGSSGPDSVGLNLPPAPSGDLQTRILKVGADAASAGSGAQAAVPDPDRVATLSLVGGAAPKAQVAPSAAATAVTPAAPRSASAVAVAPAPVPAAAEAKMKPQPAKVAAAQPAAAPIAKPAPATPIAGGAGAAAGAAYAINLGIYADHASANRLVADARQHGFTATTSAETFQGKSVLRVRVGPFASRAAAEAARLRLKSFTKVPMTVEGAAVNHAGDAPASALAATQPGAWAVQLGAFTDQAAATLLRDRLRNQGFDGYVDSIGTARGKLWRVRSGPYASRDTAVSVRGKIAQKLNLTGNIVTQN